jgi:hypothetical protein
MFLNITMLAGLGGAAVPLVLHLLSRARYRSIDWGAMMFLQGMDVRQRQSTRLKQIILLAMRMLIVGVLAMALARPVVRGSWGPLAQEGRTTAVIVVDRSASMGFDENGKSRMELARDACLQILSTLRKGDQVSLVFVGDDGRDQNYVPSSDLQAVASRVNELTVSHARASIADGLLKAMDIFDRNERLNRELYVVCDRQAASWREIDETFQAAWQQRLSVDDAPRPRMFIIPVGGDDAENIAIQSAELVNPPAVMNSSAEVEVQVRNYGSQPRAALPLVLKIGDKEILTTTVNIAPKSTASVRAPIKFTHAGSQVITASVKTAGLQSDDAYERAVDVVAPVKVLIVSGDERAGAFRSESDFVRLALAPFASLKRPGPDAATVEIIPADQWSGEELRQYQVIVLANLSTFTTLQGRSLEQFVYGGGGLLIAPGNLARTDNYNSILWRGGAGILPAMLHSPTASDGSGATALLGIKGRPDPVPSATIGRYFPTSAGRADARVLARYVTGQPFAIEVALGRGRVMLLTTPLDADWNTLPLSNFYLPFIQSTVRYLAAGTLVNRNLEPGATLDEPVDTKTIRLTRPDGQTEDLEVLRYHQRAEIRYGNTETPGLYRLSYRSGGQNRQVHYVVQTPRDESDLAPLTQERIDQIRQLTGAEWLDPNAAPISAALAGSRSGKELWGTLLACVLGLSIVEMVFARMWSRQET